MDKQTQKIEEVKGRPMLYWYGKKPLQSIEYFPAQEKEIYGDSKSQEFNKLFWGDNLQVLSHLLKDYRGKVDLIYIDPPFDSKADYVRKVKIKGQELDGVQNSLLEEKQYTDIWSNDEYLQFIYERLQIMRELLSDKGSIYLHCDYRRLHVLRNLMDEVFGEDNFLNSLVWMFSTRSAIKSTWKRTHNDILFYKKNEDPTFNWNDDMVRESLSESTILKYKYEDEIGKYRLNGRNIKGSPCRSAKDVDPELEKTHPEWVLRDYLRDGKSASDYFFIEIENQASKVRTDYPTQKPEELLYKLISASTKENSLVMDCFCGSGTTLAVAQKLGRRWLGCDINLGAIQTTTKRLNQILQDQSKEPNFKGLNAFKVLNVNEYDMFKNEMEAKEIIMDMYGIEPIKRSYFDGTLDNKYVKVMPLNRILNKLDITEVIKNIAKTVDKFTAKKTSRADEETYEESVLVIGSGIEGDVIDFIKKENKTHVKIEVRDIQSDKKNLIFKRPPEAQIEVKVDKNKLQIEILDFHSPLLMQKIQLENEKRLKEDSEAKVEDFKQIIDSVSIDVNYDGKLFNAEIMDLPDKKTVIKAKYEFTYSTKGKQTIAVKIIDVLGEEYFETFSVEVKNG